VSAETLPYEDHHSTIEVDSPIDFRKMMAEVEPHLSEEGRQAMRAEVGEALLKTLATGDAIHVNRCVEAWYRTLLLKSLGTDELLEEQPHELPDRVGISFDELRELLV
jgi:hypothetical protein